MVSGGFRAPRPPKSTKKTDKTFKNISRFTTKLNTLPLKSLLKISMFSGLWGGWFGGVIVVFVVVSYYLFSFIFKNKTKANTSLSVLFFVAVSFFILICCVYLSFCFSFFSDRHPAKRLLREAYF